MPSTAIWKGQLTFGLVSFPVRLVKAARKERIALKYVREKGSGGSKESRKETALPVHREFSAGDDGKPLSDADLERGYEVGPDQTVVVHKEELKKLRQATSPDMQILRAVRMQEIDPLFLETSYYALPGPGGEHPYALFYGALSETEYAALAQVAMHGREHVMVVRAGKTGIIAHTMYYVNEVHGADEYSTDLKGVAEKELGLAKRLVEAIAEPFKPEEFTDKYREKLQALIASKSASATPASEPKASTQAGKVVDIMDALRKSLDAAKSGARKPTTAKAEKKPHRRTA